MADLYKVMGREQLCSEHAALCFMEAQRRDKAQQKQAAMVLNAFDDLEHADKREQLDKKAEVSRASRQRL
ncbi:MAG: hypothetical protein Q8L79_03200 [Methylobacter sp.]|uniref:hypothetical protein n=1 Tax=Methylobacter sp. TaxID=2051955 RepID=UPI002730D157|nr:hypothetical protein [Methylobacter sp.]MDP1664108.1 hypothetical protein [Methylobacter sp.]